MSNGSAVTPGYHPDPWSAERMRWWDGERWTESTIPGLPALPGLADAVGPRDLGGLPAPASQPAAEPAATTVFVAPLPSYTPEAPPIPLPPPVTFEPPAPAPRTPPVAVAAPPSPNVFVGPSRAPGDSHGTGPPKAPPASRRRSKLPVIVAAVAMLVLVVGGVALLAGGDDEGDGDATGLSATTSVIPTIGVDGGGGAPTVVSTAATIPAENIDDQPAASSSDTGSISTASPAGGATTAPATNVVNPETTVPPAGATPTPTAPPTNSSGGTGGPGTVFDDPRGNFRIRVGETWEPLANSGDQISAWSVGPPAGGLRENVTVVSEPLPSTGISIDEYLDAAIGQLDSSQPDLDVVDRSTVALTSGLVGGRIEYEGSVNGVDVHIVQIVAVSATKAVVATFTASPDRFDESIRAVEPILLTLEVI